MNLRTRGVWFFSSNYFLTVSPNVTSRTTKTASLVFQDRNTIETYALNSDWTSLKKKLNGFHLLSLV